MAMRGAVSRLFGLTGSLRSVYAEKASRAFAAEAAPSHGVVSQASQITCV